ncbi:uncharacterized protein LOC128200177 isoform X2 [Galleria mellonella]|nr:uncharacterized protein LOC128200177 isoform X2 [Galleria mellonella]XP_052748638.1 uncharacterized protein LOC128200177 isoform X2 [Galleria mellonella]XP_052748641.1 uncharacterized protein LOC128200177 isoform X2 [Galleria mellonella]XP_052748642.1 uncharacterized protein LOC128200177 isoform X2 [Galleria mellonella]
MPLYTAPVNPARCPTNKIAPHRRVPSLGNNRARTFGGAFVELFTPDVLQNGSQNNLQESPQDDDDCGEIEDYDETDIGSLTSQSQRRNGRNENRYFFGLFNNIPQQQGPPTKSTRVTQPPYTTYRPQNHRPQNSYPPTRPPYWSGGHFGNNVYRPPQHLNPSDNVKPVHEYSDTQVNYWPGIVGGIVSNIFPASPARPTVGSDLKITTPRSLVTSPHYFSQSTRRPRHREVNNDNSVLRSFVHLFF